MKIVGDVQIEFSDKQAHGFARAIYKDVGAYVESYRAEYELWLVEYNNREKQKEIKTK